MLVCFFVFSLLLLSRAEELAYYWMLSAVTVRTASSAPLSAGLPEV
jgi:hypothetical protein